MWSLHLIFQAFLSVFLQAIHLRCFNHFKANVEDKLNHFEKHSLQAILADTMGRVSSCIKELGLVDADDKGRY